MAGVVHQRHRTPDEIGDIGEAARLAAIAVNGDQRARERLTHDVGDHAAIVRAHTRTVGIENARHADVHTPGAVEIEHQCFGGALALVIAGARAGAADVAVIALLLWVLIGIAIHLARGGEQ